MAPTELLATAEADADNVKRSGTSSGSPMTDSHMDGRREYGVELRRHTLAQESSADIPSSDCMTNVTLCVSHIRSRGEAYIFARFDTSEQLVRGCLVPNSIRVSARQE